MAAEQLIVRDLHIVEEEGREIRRGELLELHAPPAEGVHDGAQQRGLPRAGRSRQQHPRTRLLGREPRRDLRDVLKVGIIAEEVL